jgi:hypothetical protein
MYNGASATINISFILALLIFFALVKLLSYIWNMSAFSVSKFVNVKVDFNKPLLAEVNIDDSFDQAFISKLMQMFRETEITTCITNFDENRFYLLFYPGSKNIDLWINTSMGGSVFESHGFPSQDPDRQSESESESDHDFSSDHEPGRGFQNNSLEHVVSMISSTVCNTYFEHQNETVLCDVKIFGIETELGFPESFLRTANDKKLIFSKFEMVEESKRDERDERSKTINEEARTFNKVVLHGSIIPLERQSFSPEYRTHVMRNFLSSPYFEEFHLDLINVQNQIKIHDGSHDGSNYGSHEGSNYGSHDGSRDGSYDGLQDGSNDIDSELTDVDE